MQPDQMPAELKEALDARAARVHDYSQFVATQDIPVPYGHVLAYNKGNPVPASNVERWKLDTTDNYVGEVVVARVGTREAADAQGVEFEEPATKPASRTTADPKGGNK